MRPGGGRGGGWLEAKAATPTHRPSPGGGEGVGLSCFFASRTHKRQDRAVTHGENACGLFAFRPWTGRGRGRSLASCYPVGVDGDALHTPVFMMLHTQHTHACLVIHTHDDKTTSPIHDAPRNSEGYEEQKTSCPKLTTQSRIRTPQPASPLSCPALPCPGGRSKLSVVGRKLPVVVSH